MKFTRSSSIITESRDPPKSTSKSIPYILIPLALLERPENRKQKTEIYREKDIKNSFKSLTVTSKNFLWKKKCSPFEIWISYQKTMNGCCLDDDDGYNDDDGDGDDDDDDDDDNEDLFIAWGSVSPEDINRFVSWCCSVFLKE